MMWKSWSVRHVKDALGMRKEITAIAVVNFVSTTYLLISWSGEEMYRDFFLDDAVNELNLPASAINRVRNKFEQPATMSFWERAQAVCAEEPVDFDPLGSHPPPPSGDSVFGPALKSVLRTLRMDCWTRFSTSERFKEVAREGTELKIRVQAASMW
eukprot:EC790870.1.p1 GENE.EC790870.1~~EC790870.1.p1  ORF type:complete len:156 (+),score=32.91 EC790870.1:89-556(+)